MGYNTIHLPRPPAANNQTTPTAGNPRVGTYTVIVTDANSCTFEASRTIDESDPIVLSVDDANNALFNTSSDGSASVSATGNFSSYAFF